jgi:predicted nucleotidyltransferase
MKESEKPRIKRIRRLVVPILRRNGVVQAGIFGSFARGTAGKKSDLDFLIEMKKGGTLLDLVGLKLELEGKLGRKVDLLTYNSIYHLLRERILEEEIRIL